MNDMIGERLKQARLAAGITQKVVGLEVGVTASQISQIEKGKKFPSLDVFLKMADLFNVAPEYILGRDTGVTSDNTEYIVHIASKDLEILSTIKEYENLYKLLSSDRMQDVIASWSRRL